MCMYGCIFDIQFNMNGGWHLLCTPPPPPPPFFFFFSPPPPPPNQIWLFSPVGACLNAHVCQQRYTPTQRNPTKTRSLCSVVFTHLSDAALLRGVSSRTPCFVYSESERHRRRRLRELDEGNSCWQQRLQTTLLKYSQIKAICPRVRLLLLFSFFYLGFFSNRTPVLKGQELLPVSRPWPAETSQG